MQMTTYGYAMAAGVLPGGGTAEDGPVMERLPGMMPATGQYFFSMRWVNEVGLECECPPRMRRDAKARVASKPGLREGGRPDPLAPPSTARWTLHWARTRSPCTASHRPGSPLVPLGAVCPRCRVTAWTGEGLGNACIRSRSFLLGCLVHDLLPSPACLLCAQVHFRLCAGRRVGGRSRLGGRAAVWPGGGEWADET